jgi:hydroxyacylglutathione hydrolase
MIIEQILVTDMAVFCYLISSGKSCEGVLIDPAGDFDDIFKKVRQHNSKIKYIINTHCHWDHASGNDYMMQKTGAQLLVHEDEIDNPAKKLPLYGIKNSADSPAALLRDGDIIKIENLDLNVIHTPGHSEGSISIFTNGNIFTGDTLFTEGMGRTDFAGGSQVKIMNSIRKKILALPDDTVIWPGHNYGRNPYSTVKEQKRYYF